ncbi:MAG: 23S rRNA (adenine(2503)-C(2))-methyltransferase RlmN [Planctomycetes bacterium]|nr:23S rRNA (adenine(2503)-C(2))-methyltransferase RlmN [Planctomycetota bacterium]
MPSPIVDVLGLTHDEFLAAARAALPEGHGIASQLYRQALQCGGFDFSRLGTPVPATRQAQWQDSFRVGLLTPQRILEERGTLGATIKAVLATADGYRVETVLIPMRAHADGRLAASTQCLSTQVGCRMGCTFCETARLGLIRNLSAAEIVSQVVTARVRLGWRAKNLVFMGMGEPLDNWDALHQALRVLSDPHGLSYGQDRITICTSGHLAGIERLAKLGWKRLNLSISLTSADDETRSRLMPINRSAPLARLQQALLAYRPRRCFALGVNYCLLPGINDRREDAARVAAFCRPLGRCLVNVIPYNPGSQPLTRPPTDEEVDCFIGWLREEGLAVRRRITKGRSIMAACGQLGNSQRSRETAGV